MTRSHREPKTAIGSRREVEVSCCVWIDLLGYGSMLKAVKFDPSTSEAQKAIARLHDFHRHVASHSTRDFKTLVMNDGAIAYRDLSPRSAGVTIDFLVRSYRLFSSINQADFAAGFPGARAVLAAGFRARRHDDSKDRFIRQVGQRLISKVESKEMTVEAAILQALAVKPPFDIVPELQANFAFTKAFLVDEAGTEAGFKGPHFFIDINVLPSTPPDWIKISRYIDFTSEGMSGRFGQVQEIDQGNLGLHSNGLLDAFDISINITGDTETVQRLKNLTRRDIKR